MFIKTVVLKKQITISCKKYNVLWFLVHAQCYYLSNKQQKLMAIPIHNLSLKQGNRRTVILFTLLCAHFIALLAGPILTLDYSTDIRTVSF